MKTMSAEFHAAPSSAEFDAIEDGYYARGRRDKQAGRKMNLKGIPQRFRYLYMAAFRAS